ncbi:hypothetical protein K1X22_21780 [Mycolicibacterium farcinogenes]|uniref:hypothetical protein n=1 Tax=Mycolicibacterium farcinogenes TaxID=1802 RepID=UPI001C8E1E1B|nr:hypothetical protein [Mycolicibacterium farcinogenes]QZH58860.1 hypothetical protein K1X22_21780 [Mycolicibacterium farcinogenes]
MRILLLDAELAIGAVSAEFSSTHSMYDYDVVLWDPHRSVYTYDELHGGYTDRSFEGRRWLPEGDSARIKRDAERRGNEIVEFLKLGRTLVVFVPGDITVKIETGEKEYSGSGRSQKTTTILRDFDILDETLPLEVRRHFSEGVDMEPMDSSIGPMYRETVDYWMYGSVIESDHPVHPLLRVTGTDKVVAAEIDWGGGRIVLLPYLRVSEDESEDEDEDGTSGGSEASRVAELAAVDNLVVQWVLARITTEEVDWPSWIDEYQFQSELDRAPAISELQVKAAEIQAQLDHLLAEDAKDRQWKLLVAGSGTPLEIAVADALRVLGFDLQPVVPGRTDVRGTYNGQWVVVETKGVSKSAAEGYSAQLEKWVAEEVVAERPPKGILIINAWQKKAPLERTQPAFPPQMLPYAEKRDHCLVTGLQLLSLARAALAQPDRADELASLLIKTTGVLEGWDDPTELFGATPPVVAKKSAPKRRRNSDSESV